MKHCVIIAVFVTFADQQPSRKKIFSEIQTTTDLKTWEIEDFEKNILCAKVYNPAILNPNNEKWG